MNRKDYDAFEGVERISVVQDPPDIVGIPSPGDERAVVDLRTAVLLINDQLVIAGVIGPATSEKVRALLADEVTP